MKSYYLRTDTQAEMTQALISAGVLLESEFGPYEADGVALDIIGTIYEETDEIDEEGFPVFAAKDGWHANLLAELTAEQEEKLPILEAPENPYRVFAGETA